MMAILHALHYACLGGHPAVADYLLQYGAEIDSRDKNGFSPFHRACHATKLSMVQLLISKGCDITSKAEDGRSDVRRAASIEELLRDVKTEDDCGTISDVFEVPDRNDERDGVEAVNEDIERREGKRSRSDAGGDTQSYSFYRGAEFERDSPTLKMYGYVFNRKCLKAVMGGLNAVKARKYNSIKSFVLCEHMNAICTDLFDSPVDHWHLLVYYDCVKPSDSAFHRAFFSVGKRGLDWKSQLIHTPDSMLKYVQCEPRKVTQIYGPVSFRDHYVEVGLDKAEMQMKIEMRDQGKKKHKWDDTDWFANNGFNPQKLTDKIIKNGCVTVNRFLLYAKKYLPNESYGSFVFSREKPRLEKEINDCIKRHYYMLDFYEGLETRKLQIERLVAKDQMYTVAQRIEWLNKICMLNRIEITEFVHDIDQLVLKRHAKKNCLYLYGEANSCKSAICRSLVNGCPNVGMAITSSEFMFNECVNVNLIFSEETRVTHDVCLLKRVYEGASVTANRKCRDGYELPRSPVLCCSNYQPWKFVPNEKETLLARMFYHELSKHEELIACNKPLNPLMWLELKNMYNIDYSDDNLFY